ncbi:hypothetical protein NZ698_00595 [Chryseobacterium sp. PBS4-4]|uniref:Uncharacterized protein n=1 Tax=Chryseobacterium edaphi TaxID=2976532 RepID=A0ABT2W2W8_9FLAO|nr:hypothetical protein [Chryseobacterium edaphi]MCU7615679.1 hypothetical protein [Chryseobacterium edaphi]
MSKKQVDSFLEKRVKSLNEWLNIQDQNLDEKEQQEIDKLYEKIKSSKNNKWKKIYLSVVIDNIATRYSQVDVW